MSTITYVKGLPTPEIEMNSLGFTSFEMFLTDFSSIFRQATIRAVEIIKKSKNFDKIKGKVNTELQKEFGLNMHTSKWSNCTCRKQSRFCGRMSQKPY